MVLKKVILNKMSKKYPLLSIYHDPVIMSQDPWTDYIRYLGNNKWYFKLFIPKGGLLDEDILKESFFDSSTDCFNHLKSDEVNTNSKINDLVEYFIDYINENIKGNEKDIVVCDLLFNNPNDDPYLNSLNLDKMNSKTFHDLLSTNHKPIKTKDYILDESDIKILNKYFSKTEILNLEVKELYLKLNDDLKKIKKKYSVERKWSQTYYDLSKMTNSEKSFKNLVDKLSILSKFNKLMVE